ncbi:MAG: hypothetical protein ABJN51_06390 [Sneathiella sp.]
MISSARTATDRLHRHLPSPLSPAAALPVAAAADPGLHTTDIF